jgi:hypothetical protein
VRLPVEQASFIFTINYSLALSPNRKCEVVPYLIRTLAELDA